MMVKIASVLLIIQNLSIYAFLNFGVDTNIMLWIVLSLDLVGFSLLAVGFYLHSREYKQYRDNFLIAAAGIIGWLVNRLYWQFTIDVGSLEDSFVISFALSAVFLFISGLSRLNNEYFMFTIVNLVAVLSISLGLDTDLVYWGLLIKVFVVPLFAILAFWSLYSNKFHLLALPYYAKL